MDMIQPNDKVLHVKVTWQIETQHTIRVPEGRTIESVIEANPTDYILGIASNPPREGSFPVEGMITLTEVIKEYE